VSCWEGGRGNTIIQLLLHESLQMFKVRLGATVLAATRNASISGSRRKELSHEGLRHAHRPSGPHHLLLRRQLPLKQEALCM